MCYFRQFGAVSQTEPDERACPNGTSRVKLGKTHTIGAGSSEVAREFLIVQSAGI
jgi:hypothetical protein